MSERLGLELAGTGTEYKTLAQWVPYSPKDLGMSQSPKLVPEFRVHFLSAFTSNQLSQRFQPCTLD